ncbi:MAG: hypothetical protein CMF69_09010 [Magnetovibrio sp.]|nr:hypothetical protein [Magnetovibrio sp.]|tara:strand:+ start:346 stop:828 length:483 start_codon:yes stop_codon:yes gene_type:complete
MISLDFYIAFIFATISLILIPGPVVTITVAISLARGAKYGIVTVSGATLGTAVLLSIGSIGMVWFSKVLTELLTVLRRVGSAYSIFLGIKQFFNLSAKAPIVNKVSSSIPGVLLAGFLAAFSNPKTMLFCVAFSPQFLNVSTPIGPQLWLLSITFVGIAF